MSIHNLSWFRGDVILAILIAILASFYFYAIYQLSYWKRRGVYSPPTNVIFGNIKDAMLFRMPLGRLMAGFYNDRNTDDPCVGFYGFHKPCLIVRDPELIKSVMIKDFDAFQDRNFGGDKKKNKDIAASHNLFTMNNPQWKYLRNKLSPSVSTGKIRNMAPLMIECAETMVKYIDERPVDQNNLKNIKFKDLSSKYTTDIVATVAFGVRTNSFQDPEPEFRRRGSQLFVASLLESVMFLLQFFYPSSAKYYAKPLLKESDGFFKKIFWDSVNYREKSGEHRGDLIDHLIKLKNEDQQSEFQFAGDYLFAQSAIFFVAGHETSAMTMTFAIVELANHQDIQDRARADVIEQIETHGTTLEAFQSMKYLNQIMQETLRLYPPAPIIDRITTKDYQIPGTKVVIEKGTPVFIPLPGLHEDPKYFPEPMKFDPERFSDERRCEIVPMTFMPFGDGPRICIGQRIGNLQSLIGVALILRDYKVKVNPQKPAVINPRSIFTNLKDDTEVIFEKVTPKSTA